VYWEIILLKKSLYERNTIFHSKETNLNSNTIFSIINSKYALKRFTSTTPIKNQKTYV
jgi:hypothetical protein